MQQNLQNCSWWEWGRNNIWRKEVILPFSSTYHLEGPQLCFSHACTCLYESSLPPGGRTSKKWLTSNAAKVEHLKSGGGCTSNEEAGLGQVQASENNPGRLSDSPRLEIFSRFVRCQINLEVSCLTSFYVPLWVYACVNLSSGCLLPLINSHLW